MGWSPTALPAGTISIVVGLLLLTNPVVVDATDVGDPDWYRYEAAEITFDDEGIEVPNGIAEFDPDVVCIEPITTRACMLELGIRRQGGLHFDGLPREFLDHDYGFVYDYGEGFYRPVAEEANGTVRYDLEPVPREEAMDAIATEFERASPAIQRTIRDGPVETSDRLPGANELVATDDGYFVVHAAAYHEENGVERTGSVVFLQWVGGLLGAGLVLRGQRMRVESEY